MWPKLIDTGSFFLPTYGAIVAVAFITAIWVTRRLAKQAELDVERVTNLAVYCGVAGIMGAKLFMFLFDWSYYSANPREIFSFSTMQAAGVYQGGLIVAVLTAFAYMWRQGLPRLTTADVFAPGVALGHGIGRLGCFAAGCCWGDKCDLPWAVTFTKPAAKELTGVPLDVPLHPTQLYEFGGEIVIFGVLWWYFHRRHRPGSVIGLYMVLYSIARFFVEFVRNHEQPLITGLSLTQWISLVTLVAGLWLVFRQSTTVKPAIPVST